MKILGIDPGTRNTGVGLIEAQGNHYKVLAYEVVRAKAKEAIAERLFTIHTELRRIIKEYDPDVVSLENVFYGKDLKAMVKIGEARACAMLAASEHGVSVVEYAPAQIKKSVAGNGAATKDQMQQMVKRLLNLKEVPPPDAADALAIAICHYHLGKTKALLEKALGR